MEAILILHFGIFVLLPMILGSIILVGLILSVYWKWLWCGIRKECPICGTIIEITIND